jgi:hypothetical protein
MFRIPQYFSGIKIEDMFSSRSITLNMKKLEDIIKDEKRCVRDRVEALDYYSSYQPNDKNVDSLLSTIKTDDSSLFFIYSKVVPSPQHIKKLFVTTDSEDIKVVCVNYLFERLSDGEKKILVRYHEKKAPQLHPSELEKEITKLSLIRDAISDMSKSSGIKNNDLLEAVCTYFSDEIDKKLVTNVFNDYFNQ